MFGCVVDTLGYRDQFTQIDQTKFLIQLPDIQQINYISVFTTNPETLSTIAAQIIIQYGSHQEPIGYLADFQPSLTFLAPKHLIKQGENSASISTYLVIIASPLDQVVQRDRYALTQIENSMVDFQLNKMMTHFHESIEKFVQKDDAGSIFIPLGQIHSWKERYQKYLNASK